MKQLLILFSLFLFSCQSFAQPTWIQRTYFELYNPYQNHDSLTGMREIEIGDDGAIYVLAFCNQDADERLMKFEPDSGTLLWENFVGGHGGITGHMVSAVSSTRDSGCVITKNDWGFVGFPQVFGKIEKYSRNGFLQWSHDFDITNSTVAYTNAAVDVAENSYGNIFAMVGDGYIDTLFEFDKNGNIIFQTGNVVGYNLFRVSDGELLVFTQHQTIDRIDSTGFIYWSLPCQGVLGADSTIAYILTQSGIQKVQLSTGQILWTKSFPFGLSSVVVLADGGFIGCSGKIPRGVFDISPVPYYLQNSQIPGSISRVDSSGNIIWTKQYDFPKYGLSCVKRLNSGNIVTGGAFMFTNCFYNYPRDYSSFIATLDSSGNSVLDSISYTWPGDANNNQYVSLVDDVLNTGIALGYSGPHRDTLLTPFTSFPFTGIHSDYAIDWATSFNNAVNHKHADFNGDGRIDTTDMLMYGIDYPMPCTIPNWRMKNDKNQSAFIPDLKFSALSNSVQAGDTIRYYIILGSGLIPVDTIYGLAFHTNYAYDFQDSETSLDFINGHLGSAGLDLFTSFPAHDPSQTNLAAVWCRTDRHDVYNVINDTLGILKISTDPTWTTITSLNLRVVELKAVKFDESLVNLNVIIDSVVVFPIGSGIESMLTQNTRVYPNPVNSKLTISGIPSEIKSDQIELTDLLGVKMPDAKIRVINSDNSISLDLSNYTNGIYYIKFTGYESDFVRKIIVQH